jgi:Xaa-Pro dipeptidase
VAKNAFLNGASEYQIHLAYLQATELMEHELPYGNIIALNDHGAVLHYTELQRQSPPQSHSFLIDAGASFNGYAADITRTYSAQNDEFAGMVAAMDQMEQQLIADIKPGKAYFDVHLEAHYGVANILRDFDLVRDLSVEAMVAEGVSSVFYPHGIGHLLGLQVHDVGGRFLNQKGEPNLPPAAHPFLRLTRQIDCDMVFTIEPGLYFIDMLLTELKNKPQARHLNWTKVDSLKKFGGIRIEDNVVVQQNGVRNLTREAFAAQR